MFLTKELNLLFSKLLEASVRQRNRVWLDAMQDGAHLDTAQSWLCVRAFEVSGGPGTLC